jgi:LPS export ABC transporter protein LptC
MVFEKKIRLMKMKIYIALLCSSCFFYACKSNLEKINTIIDKQEMDTEKADSVTVLYSSNGTVKAKLQAKTFVHVSENTQPYAEMKNGLKVLFYDANHSVVNTLTAKRGRYFEKNNNVLLRDSVFVKNSKNEELRTEELIWNEQSQLFFTEKHVTITTATQIISGDGMEANQDFSHYKIINPTGIISINRGSVPMN